MSARDDARALVQAWEIKRHLERPSYEWADALRGLLAEADALAAERDALKAVEANVFAKIADRLAWARSFDVPDAPENSRVLAAIDCLLTDHHFSRQRAEELERALGHLDIILGNARVSIPPDMRKRANEAAAAARAALERKP